MILTVEELCWCRRIAEHRELSHGNEAWNGYDIDAHFLGVLGEFVFAREHGIPLSRISDVGADPGYDFRFVLGGGRTLRVDVKTKSWNGPPPLKWFVKEGGVWADKYCFMRFIAPRIVKPMGWLDFRDVLKSPIENPRGTFAHVVVADQLIDYQRGSRMLPKLRG